MIIKGRDTEKDLVVSNATIDKAIDEQAGLIGFYGEVWAQREFDCGIKKIELDEVYAVVDNKLRKEGKSTSEAQLKQKIVMDPLYKKANRDYQASRFEFKKIDVIMKGLDNKRDSLKLKMKRLQMDWTPEVGQRDLERDSFISRKEKAESIEVELKKSIIKLKRK